MYTPSLCLEVSISYWPNSSESYFQRLNAGQACRGFCCDHFKSWNPTGGFPFRIYKTESGMFLCQFVVGWNLNLPKSQWVTNFVPYLHILNHYIKLENWSLSTRASERTLIFVTYKLNTQISLALSILSFEHTKKSLYKMVFINGWVENRGFKIRRIRRKCVC